MNRRLTTVGSLTCLALSFAATAYAQSAISRRPNLKPLPAFNLSLVPDTTGGSTLRFSTTSWNNGEGPLELVAGELDTAERQKVYQRIYLSDGTSFLNYAGSFTYHAAHDHIHFDDYASYTLQPVNVPGGSLRTGSKMTFCVMDTDKVDGTLAGSPAVAVYSTCGRFIQGMSVGWGDTYGAHLVGQDIDFAGNPDGIYQLKIEIDPKKLIIETTENDNVSCVLLEIRNPGTVTVLDSASCSPIASITPKSAAMGTTVDVTITGYGFTPGMSVSFEGGNGPRPVASNVVVAPATGMLGTITARVAVPFKKQAGKDPVWNLRVGTDAVLSNAFTVTR